MMYKFAMELLRKKSKKQQKLQFSKKLLKLFKER